MLRKLLFLRKVVDRFRGPLYCDIESVKALEKITTAKRLRCERIDDLFDLTSDDIAADEVSIAKDGSENPLGQKMLNKHLLDRRFREIWIDGLAALIVKIYKGGGKPMVGLSFLLNQLCQSSPDVRHFVFELSDRILPLNDLLRTMRKKGLGASRLVALGRSGRRQEHAHYSAKESPVVASGTECCLWDNLPQTCAALQLAGRREYPLLPRCRGSIGTRSINAPSTTIRLLRRRVIEYSGTSVHCNCFPHDSSND